MSHSETVRLIAELEEYRDYMRVETSDRAAALTVACFLEDSLRAVLVEYRDSPKLQPYIPPQGRKKPRAGDFAGVIVRVGERALLAPPVQSNMDVIRDIRNVFAHNFRARSFANVIKDCKRLQDVAPWPADPAEEEAVARDRFLQASEQAVLEVRRLLATRAFERYDRYAKARAREAAEEHRRRALAERAEEL